MNVEAKKEKTTLEQRICVETLLTVKELAEALRVKPGTVSSWLSRGVDIPHIKIEGLVLFRLTAINAWLLARETAKKQRRFEA